MANPTPKEYNKNKKRKSRPIRSIREADLVYRSSGEIYLLQLIGRGGRKCDNKPLLMTRIQLYYNFYHGKRKFLAVEFQLKTSFKWQRYEIK